MVCLIESYIFYADVFLLQNFLVKISALYLSFRSSKQLFIFSHIKGVMKVIGVALFGSILEIVGLFLIRPYAAFLFCTYVIEFPIMLYFLSPKRNVGLFVLRVYAFTVLINGVLECFWNYFGKNAEYILMVGISSIIVILFVKVWERYRQREKAIYPVRIIHNGKEIALYGYYDSGNCLKDPYGKKGVHIISREILKEVMTQDDYSVLVPYQSLGNTNGMLEMFYIDCIYINGEKEIEQKKVPMGAAEEELFKGKSYKIILNEEVF